MAELHDRAGRPIVVVTGIGIVTSLGVGKAQNWQRLVAGYSGIHAITRFATGGLKTRIAGTIDFVPVAPLSSPALSERLAQMVAEEAIAEATKGLEAATFFQRFDPTGKQRIEVLRSHRVQHRSNVVSLGIAVISNSVWQFERPRPAPSASCR